MARVSLRINGRDRQVLVEPRASLIHVLSPNKYLGYFVFIAVVLVNLFGWQVIDVEAMSQQMKALGLGKVFKQPQLKGGETGDDVQFRATGRKETVGGISGEVYEITVREASGRVETAEAVLADNEEVVTLQRAMAVITARHVEAWSGQKATRTFEALSRAAQQQQRGALLRYEQRIRLVSLSADNLPDARFQLPEKSRTADTSGPGKAEDRPDVSDAIGEGMEKLKGLFGR